MNLLTLPLLHARRARDCFFEQLRRQHLSNLPYNKRVLIRAWCEHDRYPKLAGRCSRTKTWHNLIATRKIIANTITTSTHPSIILNISIFTTLVILHMYTTTLSRSLCPFIHRLEFCARPSGIIRSSFPLFRPENAHKLLRALRSSGSGSESTYFGRAIEGG
jgi:hypothetical protein